MFRKIALASLSLQLVWSLSAEAASVTAVKGQRVLINLEGADSAAGDEFFLINPTTSKKAAIIRIRQVKAGKAIGEIVKGRAESGYTLQAKGSSKMSAEVPVPAPVDETSPTPYTTSLDTGYLRVLKNSWGVLGSLMMDTMDAQITSTDVFGTTTKTSANMKGTSFGAGGFYDYAFTSEVVGHASAMLEQFNATGDASAAVCKSSTSCDVKITYLSLYGLGKYYFSKDKYRIWGGAGMGYLLALSKSSTALNESKISANQIMTVAFGTDIQWSRKNYIPVSLEYNYFWPSADVTANQIVIKAGWAWNL